MKIRRHLINLLILVYVWIASSFNIYLVTYELKYLPGNIFKNTLYSSVVDFPLAILGGIFYYKFGIRLALSGAFFFAMVGSLSLVFFSNDFEDLVPIMISLARGGVKVTFDICYLANSTIFPAIFAGTSFGICNIGAKIATILSPMLAEVPPPIPMIVFSAIALIAILLSNFINTEATTVNKKK